jgi:hypothetical protein
VVSRGPQLAQLDNCRAWRSGVRLYGIEQVT